MTNLHSLFETTSEPKTNPTRTLSGTAQLTKVAHEKAQALWTLFESDPEQYAATVAACKVDTAALDDIVARKISIENGELDFLMEAGSDDVLVSMLKSQQSKRSRLKKEQHTLDQFMSLMTGACAEYLLRSFMGKPKSAVTRSTHRGSASFTEEYIQELSTDPLRLAAAIRSLQSRKSVYRKKEGFNEDEPDEYFQNLLQLEARLKGLRKVAAASHRRSDETKTRLNELLGDKDATDLKPAEAKKLLVELLRASVNADDVVDTTVEDETLPEELEELEA